MQDEDQTARFTITTSKPHQRNLAELAKKYKISQGEVVEVMLDNADMNEMDTYFTRRREEKVDMRGGVDKALLAKLKSLTPEQREWLEKMTGGNPSV